MSEAKTDENGIEYFEIEFTDEDGLVTVQRVY
jgi:hypothetical protein